MRINDFQLTEHFNLIEFQCPCCHTVLLHPLLVTRLQALRLEWGRAVVINSGYRCSGHNKDVGGAAKSLHRLGRAADVRIPAEEQERFCALSLLKGFIRAIPYVKRGFIHLEIGEK